MGQARKDDNQIPAILGVSSADGLTPVIIYVDPTTNRLLVNATLSGGLAGNDTAGDGTATVTTAGTRVQLSSVSVVRVIIQAHESNTGTIVVGGSGVVAALVGRRGLALYPTQSAVFQVSNLNLLYIDSTENGDKVNFYYEAA